VKSRRLKHSGLCVGLTAAASITLSGCTASANLTIPASEVATTAATALEESVGTRPEMDCGDDSVDLVDGTVVECELTDPTSGTVFGSTVTLSYDGEGTDYSVSVDVDEQPKS
jgi:hypothetical protein